MYGTAELTDGTLISSEVPAKGLKNVVVLPCELFVAGVRTALVALDWSTGAISATDVTPNDDAAGVKKCCLTECGSDAGSVTDVMSTDESTGGVICGLKGYVPDAVGVTDVMSWCNAMVFGVPGCCTDAGGVVISDSASAFRGVAA